eukprot:7304037-Alexandrium_andersonii.AAC.1
MPATVSLMSAPQAQRRDSGEWHRAVAAPHSAFYEKNRWVGGAPGCRGAHALTDTTERLSSTHLQSARRRCPYAPGAGGGGE